MGGLLRNMVGGMQLHVDELTFNEGVTPMNGTISPTASSRVLDFITSKSGRAATDKSVAMGVTTVALSALAILFGSPENAHASWTCSTTCGGSTTSTTCADNQTCNKSCSGGSGSVSCV